MSRGVFILAGATASGKTRAAIALARRFDAEIVGADSRQIYRGMPIGTAAPTAEERAAVPHHMVEFLEPDARYSAARYAADAMRAIRDIHGRGRRVVVVGGTGFYIRALAGDVRLAPQQDDVLRARLAREAQLHPAEFLHEWLRLLDPVRAAALDSNDRYRVLRALEIALTPEPAALDVAHTSLAAESINYAKVFLDVDLGTIDARIGARTDAMLAEGLIDEAERIGGGAVAASAVGYPQALAYLAGRSTWSELRDTLARATRRYARRQRAWFRAEPQTHWVAPGDLERAARELLGWS